MLRGLFDMLWPMFAHHIHMLQMVPQRPVRFMPHAARHSGVRRQQRAAAKRRNQKRSRQ